MRNRVLSVTVVATLAVMTALLMVPPASGSLVLAKTPDANLLALSGGASIGCSLAGGIGLGLEISGFFGCVPCAGVGILVHIGVAALC